VRQFIATVLFASSPPSDFYVIDMMEHIDDFLDEMLPSASLSNTISQSRRKSSKLMTPVAMLLGACSLSVG